MCNHTKYGHYTVNSGYYVAKEVVEGVSVKQEAGPSPSCPIMIEALAVEIIQENASFQLVPYLKRHFQVWNSSFTGG